MPEEKKPRTKAEEAEFKRRSKEREKEQAHFFSDDDGENVGEEISTQRHYVKIPVGKSVTGVYVSMETGTDLNGNPRKQPMILCNGEFVVLPGHKQLESAFTRISPGSTVKVACTELANLSGGRTAWNYRVSAIPPQGGGDLPF